MPTAALNDLGVALQSVLYYVAACTTIRQCFYRRRRQKEAVRAQKEKAVLELEQPGLYKHPLPFATNPHWEEDIRLGPGPPKRDRRKAEPPESMWAQMLGEEALRTGSGTDSDRSGGLIKSEGVVASQLGEEEKNWNLQRYQRADEGLWSEETDDLDEGATSTTQKPSVRRLPIAGLVGAGIKIQRTSESRRSAVRSPPFNDYQSPVVTSLPTDGSQLKWMLQPPPSAKLMEGKEPASRSRASSGATRQRAGTGLSKHSSRRDRSDSMKMSNARTSGPRSSEPDLSEVFESQAGPDSSSDLFNSAKTRNELPIIAIADDDSLSPRSSLTASPKRPALLSIASSPIITVVRRPSPSRAVTANDHDPFPLRELLPNSSGFLTSNILNARSSSPNYARSNHERDAVAVSSIRKETEENGSVISPVLNNAIPPTFRFPETTFAEKDPRQRWSMGF